MLFSSSVYHLGFIHNKDKHTRITPLLHLVRPFECLSIPEILYVYHFNLKRSDQVIFHELVNFLSLSLGMTYLSKEEQQPECIYCDCPLTIYHIFGVFRYTYFLITYSHDRPTFIRRLVSMIF